MLFSNYYDLLHLMFSIGIFHGMSLTKNLYNSESLRDGASKYSAGLQSLMAEFSPAPNMVYGES